MSALDSLKDFIERRLTAAVEEIFEYFEKTVSNYEEELDRYREMLDIMLLPEIRLRREDVHSLTVRAKIPSEQQEVRPILRQEALQPLSIKEEQEGEQLHGLTEFPFVYVNVKSEDDEENLQLPQSQPEENMDADHPENPDDTMRIAADGEDSGGPEPEINQKDHLNRFNGGKMRGPFSCLFCGKHCCSKSELVKHKRGHTREKPYYKSLQQNSSLQSQVRDHTEEKPLKCSDCGECFSHRTTLKQHVRHHKRENAIRGRSLNRKSQIKTCEGAGNSSR